MKMPIFENMVCDSLNQTLNGALRGYMSSENNHNNDDINLEEKLQATAQRWLIARPEYEEAPNYKSPTEKLKGKYLVLRPTPNVVTNGEKHNGSATNSTQVNTSSGSSNINGKAAPSLPQPKVVLFPRENIKIGWKAGGKKWNVGSGFINMGNTCYLNSTLQALFHVPSVAHWLLSEMEHYKECVTCVICAVLDTFQESQRSNMAVRPQPVYDKLKQICKHLMPGRQEDAHEFLRYLVEAMERSYLHRHRNWKELDQYSKETTPLNQILGGYLRSTVRCLSCNYISTTFQHFEDLPLDIRKVNSVEEAIKAYFALERLEDMDYKCESCKKRVSAVKQFSLERAPIALCLQLKRFSIMGGKLNKPISVQKKLNLTSYATNRPNGGELSYRLVSIVTHIGASQHCGHYTAIGLADNNQYYQFDDSYVRPINNVLETQAYVLFYELEPRQLQSPQLSRVSEIDMFEVVKQTPSTTSNGLGNSHQTNASSSSSSSTSNSKPERQPGFIGPMLPQERPAIATFKLSNGHSSKLVNLNKSSGQENVTTGTSNNIIKQVNGVKSPVKTVITATTTNGVSKSPVPSLKVNGIKSLVTTHNSMPTKTLNGFGIAVKKPLTSLVVTKVATTNGDSAVTAKPQRIVPYDSDGSDNETSDTGSVTAFIKTKSGTFEEVEKTVDDGPSLRGSTQTCDAKSENNSPQYNQTEKTPDRRRSPSTPSSNKSGFNGTTNTKEVVCSLIKMGGQQGYGAPVKTWNGETSKMDKEVQSEKREERKRQFEDDRETEMDRGKVKKVNHRRDLDDNYERRHNGNHNAFQSYQDRENSFQSRGKWMTNHALNRYRDDYNRGNNHYGRNRYQGSFHKNNKHKRSFHGNNKNHNKRPFNNYNRPQNSYYRRN